MSTAFAIAAVSACVRELLQNHLSMAGVASLVGGNLKVGTRPPDRVLGTGSEDPNQVNWFLHRVSNNTGWQNQHLPSRDSSGHRIEVPPLALNLHYMLTVFAARELHAEILLGHAMQALHEASWLGREAIRRSLSPAVPPADWPAELAASGLADQIEAIKLTLQPAAEEAGRIWSSVNAHYRTSALYEASVVLIESRLQPKRPLPAKRSMSRVVSLNHPRLEQAVDAADPQGAITPSSTLRLVGSRLKGNDTRLILGSRDVTSAATQVTSSEILQPLNGIPGLRAGFLPIKVTHHYDLGDPPVAHGCLTSNVIGVVLHPEIVLGAVVIDASRVVDGVTYRSGRLAVTIKPAVDAEQQVFLLLNELNPPAGRAPRSARLTAPVRNGVVPPATEVSVIEFSFTDVAEGGYLVRLSVNGGESELTLDGNGLFAAPSILV